MAKFLTGIRFHFRDAVWSDANKSGSDQSSFEVPVLCEQENYSSNGVSHKNYHFDTRWWNVAAGQKAGEVKHCSMICLYKKTRKYI